ncbi:hypothetical protein AB3X90_40920, partial [Paraburkholderia sp. BR14427]
ATALVYGTALLLLLAGATRMLGRFNATRLHHLTQGLIPIAGAVVVDGFGRLVSAAAERRRLSVVERVISVIRFSLFVDSMG